MNPLRTLLSLPRPIRVVFVATLVNRMGSMVLPFLLLYLTQDRRASADEAGAVLGLYGAGALVAGPLAGVLVNRAGARVVMTLSLLSSAAVLLALLWVESTVALAALVFLWALTGEAFRPAAAAVVAEHVAPEQRRSAYAVLRLAVNLGLSIGPAIGGFLAEHSYDALFVADAVTSLAAAGSLVLLGGGITRASARRDLHGDARANAAPNAPAEPSSAGPFALHLVGTALIALVAYQGLSTLPLYMTDTLSLRDSSYGLVYALSGLIIVVCEVPLTLLVARFSHRRLLVSGAFITGLGFAALAGSTTFAAVVLTTFVWSAGEMLLGPATNARVADLEPPHRRGLYVGLHSAVWSGAFALGPWLGMQTFQGLGPPTHWLVVGATGVVAAALFAIQPRRRGTGAATKATAATEATPAPEAPAPEAPPATEGRTP